MKKKTKLALAILGVIGVASSSIMPYAMAAEETSTDTIKKIDSEIQLVITNWNLTITHDTALLKLLNNTNTDRSPSFKDQTVSAKFAKDAFKVTDLKWAKVWYYTTISASPMYRHIGDTKDTEDTYAIPANLIKFTPESRSAEERKIDWAENAEVKVNNCNLLESVKTYFYRQADKNEWILGEYGDSPTVEVTIPANRPSWRYQWTITYTLYDMSEQGTSDVNDSGAYKGS